MLDARQGFERAFTGAVGVGIVGKSFINYRFQAVFDGGLDDFVGHGGQGYFAGFATVFGDVDKQIGLWQIAMGGELAVDFFE